MIASIVSSSCHTKCSRQPSWVCRDNKERRVYFYYSQYSSRTYEKVCLTKIDGGLDNSRSLKCDFLLLRLDYQVCYFIELKGGDLEQAARQLLQTMRRLHEKTKSYVCNARAVLSKARMPDIRSQAVHELKIYCRQKHGGSFKYKTMQMKENACGIYD